MAAWRWWVFVGGFALAACAESSDVAETEPENTSTGPQTLPTETGAGSRSSTMNSSSVGSGPQTTGSETGVPEAPIVFERIELSREYLCEGASAGDLDNDGVLDIVAGPYWYAGPDFSDRHSIYAAEAFDPKAYADNFYAAVHDFDGDGFKDVLFVGFPGQRATWYQNPGSPDGTWLPNVVLTGVDGESPVFTDLTGDGRPELVFIQGGRLGWAGPSDAEPGPLWEFHPVSPDLGLTVFTHGLGVGDVDGDGRDDVLEAGGWWRQPESTAGDPTWVHHAHAFGLGGAQMFALDLNADASADIVTTYEAHGYGLAWFEQDGPSFHDHALGPRSPKDTTEGPLIHEPHALALADINGDGVTDFVTGERFWAHVPKGDPSFADPASLYWFEGKLDAGAPQWVPHLIDDASGVGTQVTPIDLNGDSRQDIVIANKKGTFVFLQVD